MTKYKWSEMSARERDALVANYVMGFRVVVTQGMYPSAKETNDALEKTIPHYSTSISAAWEVVEKLNDFFYLYKSTFIENKWECKFHESNTDRRFYVTAETAPEAICLAALRAVGVDVE